MDTSNNNSDTGQPNSNNLNADNTSKVHSKSSSKGHSKDPSKSSPKSSSKNSSKDPSKSSSKDTNFNRKKDKQPKLTTDQPTPHSNNLNSELIQPDTKNDSNQENHDLNNKSGENDCPVCSQSFNEGEFWIQCDICFKWFHAECVNVSELDVNEIIEYHCSLCYPEFGPSEYKILNNHRYDRTIDDQNHQLPTQVGTHKFIEELMVKKRKFKEFAGLTRLPGHEVTMDYLFNNGFDDPILVEKPDGLQMKIPKDFTFEKLVKKLGKDYQVEVIDVYKQETDGMKLIDLVKFMKNTERRNKILNCISLELSKTDLNNEVEPPYIVRHDLSWADNIFSEEDKPSVQKYLLISMKDSYTDFHIDFSGTSVWYHIHKGSKLFFFIRPTAKNIKAYEEWLVKENHSEIFFPDEIEDECYFFELKEGHTMLIPTGWIHGVYTPEDSVVFGGNFLQFFRADLQIQIYQLEERQETAEKFKYPGFKLAHWIAIKFVYLFFKNLIDKGKMTKESIQDNPLHRQLYLSFKKYQEFTRNYYNQMEKSTKAEDVEEFEAINGFRYMRSLNNFSKLLDKVKPNEDLPCRLALRNRSSTGPLSNNEDLPQKSVKTKYIEDDDDDEDDEKPRKRLKESHEKTISKLITITKESPEKVSKASTKKTKAKGNVKKNLNQSKPKSKPASKSNKKSLVSEPSDTTFTIAATLKKKRPASTTLSSYKIPKKQKLEPKPAEESTQSTTQLTSQLNKLDDSISTGNQNDDKALAKSNQNSNSKYYSRTLLLQYNNNGSATFNSINALRTSQPILKTTVDEDDWDDDLSTQEPSKPSSHASNDDSVHSPQSTIINDESNQSGISSRKDDFSSSRPSSACSSYDDASNQMTTLVNRDPRTRAPKVLRLSPFVNKNNDNNCQQNQTLPNINQRIESPTSNWNNANKDTRSVDNYENRSNQTRSSMERDERMGVSSSPSARSPSFGEDWDDEPDQTTTFANKDTRTANNYEDKKNQSSTFANNRNTRAVNNYENRSNQTRSSMERDERMGVSSSPSARSPSFGEDWDDKPDQTTTFANKDKRTVNNYEDKKNQATTFENHGDTRIKNYEDKPDQSLTFTNNRDTRPAVSHSKSSFQVKNYNTKPYQRSLGTGDVRMSGFNLALSFQHDNNISKNDQNSNKNSNSSNQSDNNNDKSHQNRPNSMRNNSDSSFASNSGSSFQVNNNSNNGNYQNGNKNYQNSNNNYQNRQDQSNNKNSYQNKQDQSDNNNYQNRQDQSNNSYQNRRNQSNNNYQDRQHQNRNNNNSYQNRQDQNSNNNYQNGRNQSNNSNNNYQNRQNQNNNNYQDRQNQNRSSFQDRQNQNRNNYQNRQDQAWNKNESPRPASFGEDWDDEPVQRQTNNNFQNEARTSFVNRESRPISNNESSFGEDWD